MRHWVILGGVAVLAFGAYWAREVDERRRIAEFWEAQERADYEAKKAEYGTLEAPFKKDCADFIALGRMSSSERSAALKRMASDHARSCDATATELNRRSKELGDFIRRGRDRERARGAL